jgi:sugar phosphate isomerase/epimerase
MAKPLTHASIEGAQHGAKSLDQFLAFAKTSGASGAQPSNYLLQEGAGFKSAAAIRAAFTQHSLSLDGISAHCPFWVHTSAWTGTPSIRPFIPAEVAQRSPDKIEAWAEDYLLRLFDLCAELKVKIVPMFWGVAFGWEVASGYPWGFWTGPGYDLIQEGTERFVTKTAKLRAAARQRGLHLAHEIHPGTAAMTGDDFNHLVQACDGDPVLTVNADPSHCWEGESWETRFRAVGDRVVAAHVKNFALRPGVALRKMAPDWKDRGMQFVDLPSGDLNMVRYIEMLIGIGYPTRYCQIMGTSTAPLVVEAESAYRDLDACSANGIAYTRDHLCFPLAAGSFEDGMGA